MINKSSFFGKLRKVLASVCSLVVGASGVSQAGNFFSDALGNKKGIMAHFKFGDAEESAKGATKRIFSDGLHVATKNGGFCGLLDGVCGYITSSSWGYASRGKISGIVNGAGVRFYDSDGYIVVELMHDDDTVKHIGKASTGVLRLSFEDFDYIIGKYQKDRLPSFIGEFKEVGFGGNNSLIEFLDHLRTNIEKRENVDSERFKTVADLRKGFPNRYCASILALDLFSYIFDMDLELNNPYALISDIFVSNNEYNCVKLSSGVKVLRPEVFQDAFIRKWGYVDGKPVYELEEEIDNVCKSLGIGQNGTFGDKLNKVREKASELLKSEKKVTELQKTIEDLEGKLKLAGTDGSEKEALQKQLEEAKSELNKLSPSARELKDIGDMLKNYGGGSTLEKLGNLLAKLNGLNDEVQKLQGTKFGKVAKWGGYPIALAAGYLINKFIPKGGKKLNNVNKVENRNKNKGSNRDKKAKKRNNAKKN